MHCRMAAPIGLWPLRKQESVVVGNGCKMLVGNWCTGESICNDVFEAGDVVKDWVIFFK